MTQAAKELHLTQSGVSQQIKSLEETLQIVLFDRVNRRILPTSEAEILYEKCSRSVDDLESALREITGHGNMLRGRVKIGFPPIFGSHTLSPIITDFARANPQVKFDLRTGLASEVVPLVLDGVLDFAFVDSYVADSYLNQRVVASETLELICHKSILEQKEPYRHDLDFYRTIPFIAYNESESILNSWFKANFAKGLADPIVRATVMDSNVAARLACEGFGAAIVPKNLAETLLSTQQHMTILSSLEKVTNSISVVRLGKRTTSAAAQKCYDWLCQALETHSS